MFKRFIYIQGELIIIFNQINNTEAEKIYISINDKKVINKGILKNSNLKNVFSKDCKEYKKIKRGKYINYLFVKSDRVFKDDILRLNDIINTLLLEVKENDVLFHFLENKNNSIIKNSCLNLNNIIDIKVYNINDVILKKNKYIEIEV